MQYNLSDTSSEESNVSEEEVSGKVEPKYFSVADIKKEATSPRREVSSFNPVHLGLILSAASFERADRVSYTVLTGECT